METTPRCKPLRLTEWFTMIVCFTFLFFTRCHTFDQVPILTPSELIFFFTTFGSLLLLLGCDVFSQLIKNPTTNVPMIFVCLTASVLCCACGFTLAISHEENLAESEFDKRILGAMSILVAGSFFAAVVFVIDAMILFRFA